MGNHCGPSTPFCANAMTPLNALRMEFATQLKLYACTRRQEISRLRAEIAAIEQHAEKIMADVELPEHEPPGAGEI